MAYPVQAFGLHFVASAALPPVPDAERDGLRQQAGLFAQMENGKKEEFKSVHDANASAFHDPHDAEEESNGPRFQFQRILFRNRNERFGVVLQFLVTPRTRISVKEVAEFSPTMGTFG